MTFVATRELRAVYFDGSSAAKLASGTLDTQNILIRGGLHNARPPMDDEGRLVELCEWGKEYDVDGFIRLGIVIFRMRYIPNTFSTQDGASFVGPQLVMIQLTNLLTVNSWHATSVLVSNSCLRTRFLRRKK